MFGSTVLDVVFGLVFVYYALALLCAGVVEMIANWVRKRAKYLLRGVQDLIEGTTSDDSGVTGSPKRWRADAQAEMAIYARALTAGASPATAGQDEVAALRTEDIFGHPLIQPYRQTTAAGQATRNPSYIPGAAFAAALTDLLTPGRALTTEVLEERLSLLPPVNDQLRAALQAILKTVRSDVDAFVPAVETWFDSQMDRITGSYKRWAKRWVIAVAVLVVGVGGVDSIAIARSLYTDDAVRSAVVQAADQAGSLCPAGTSDADCAASAKAKVSAVGLPIGWSASTLPKDGPNWALKIVGLLLSVGAAALGAPFWYKLLDRVGTLRNTGTPPS